MLRRPTIVINQQPTRTEYVTREIHEHRAPTDQSVALLAEMEAKARAAIIKAVHVGDATFDCVIHTARLPESDALLLKAIFSLNGRKLTVEVKDWAEPETMIVKLRDAMATQIANEILEPALRGLGPTLTNQSTKP